MILVSSKLTSADKCGLLAFELQRGGYSDTIRWNRLSLRGNFAQERKTSRDGSNAKTETKSSVQNHFVNMIL